MYNWHNYSIIIYISVIYISDGSINWTVSYSITDSDPVTPKMSVPNKSVDGKHRLFIKYCTVQY